MARIVLRRGTDAEWAAANPVLLSGEPGYSTDSGALKIGDGSTTWSALSGVGGSDVVPAGGTTGQVLQKASDDDYDLEWHTNVAGGEAFPVGSVFIAVVSTNPGTLLGYGTWSAFAAGRVLVGIDAGQTEFDTVEETGGAKTVTLTAAQSGLPQHTHTQDSHNHTQDAHTHTQNAHTHDFLPRSATTGSQTSIATTIDTSSTISGANQPHIQNATAVNQNATATNQAATATNQNAGPSAAAEAHSNLQPYIVVYMWKRTA